MTTALLETNSGGAGQGLPPITAERTPDEQGDSSSWETWERQVFGDRQIGVERIRDVGRAIRELGNQGVPRGLGNIAGSAYITVQRQAPVETSPGVYHF